MEGIMRTKVWSARDLDEFATLQSFVEESATKSGESSAWSGGEGGTPPTTSAPARVEPAEQET
jgi:hypothetical protein